MEISDRILLRLKSLDMKAVDVVKHPAAKRKGISKSNMTQWISGSGSPNLAKGVGLAAALQTNVEWLVDGIDIKAPPKLGDTNEDHEPINSLHIDIAATSLVSPRDLQSVVFTNPASLLINKIIEVDKSGSLSAGFAQSLIDIIDNSINTPTINRDAINKLDAKIRK
jgi:transcriptional regulator with XRE-family HTH domain